MTLPQRPDVLRHCPTDQSFADLPPYFFTPTPTTPLKSARLFHVNASFASDLGLTHQQIDSSEFFDLVSGAQPLPGCAALAAVYSGHQFGVWAGQLGDGRAHYLGEISCPTGSLELQLKGAGQTPYSRMADGRAVLRSSVREYLASEAMHGLGIPTTRALALVSSDDPVRRERVETAAIVTRVSPSFIRFGSFEHWASKRNIEALKKLTDFVIKRYFPECLDVELTPSAVQAEFSQKFPQNNLTSHDSAANDFNLAGLTQSYLNKDPQSSDAKYLRFFSAVVKRTAHLMAQWQTVGFCHGVMNTDNMSILGLTLDYGPFGFLDDFDAHHICNHSDHNGRYAWHAQPSVAKWNLYCLAISLSLLVESTEGLSATLQTFDPIFSDDMHQRMMAKLGLEGSTLEDEALVDDLLKLMHESGADFTLCFRELAFVQWPDSNQLVRPEYALQMGWLPQDSLSKRPFYHLFNGSNAPNPWVNRYLSRLDHFKNREAASVERIKRMLSVNPLYVLRNHLAQKAIEAAQHDDATELSTLAHLLSNPFVAQPSFEFYAQPPASLDRPVAVSCSS